MELGFFAATYLRSMPGEMLFQSEAGLASRRDERKRERDARSRPEFRSRWEGMVRKV
jgi:hypothetical protein